MLYMCMYTLTYKSGIEGVVFGPSDQPRGHVVSGGRGAGGESGMGAGTSQSCCCD